MEDNFWNQINTQFDPNPDVIRDFQDGESFKRLQKYISADAIPIILTLNADGVEVKKDSKDDFWPFFIQILNYPRFLRRKPENVCLLAVQRVPFGGEYNFDAILRSFVEELIHFPEQVVLKHPIQGKTKIEVFVLNWTGDLMARPKVIRCRAVNSYHGVMFTDQVGIRSVPRRCQVFPKPHQQHLSTEIEVMENVANKQNGFEFMDPTELWHLKYFNPIYFTCIDPMHNICEGVFKECFHFAKKLGYITNEDEIAMKKFLQLLKLPKNYNRTLYEIHKTKGIEGLLILLYCIKFFDFLPKNIFEIFSLLGDITRIIFQDKITKEELQILDTKINDFCEKTENAFSHHFMVPNMAALALVAIDIRKFGPAFNHSTFSFEGYNHNINQFIHSSENYETKVIDNWNNTPFFFQKMKNNPITEAFQTKRHQFEDITIVINGFEYGTQDSKYLSTAKTTTNKIIEIIEKNDDFSTIVQLMSEDGFAVGERFAIANELIQNPVIKTFRITKTPLSAKTTKYRDHSYQADCFFMDLLNISDLL